MRRLVCVYLAVSLSCRGGTPTPTTTVRPPAPQPAVAAPAPAPADGGRRRVALDLASASGHVSVELVAGTRALPTAAASELTPNETAALLARLEPLPPVAAAPAPSVRAPSPPPPRPGSVQPIAFVVTRGKPAADAPPEPARPAAPVPAPLAPPEISPVGEIEKETEIRIRFGEPMVPVAAVGTSDRPVATIAPAVAGTWRWIDTRVATFTAQAAYLANATEYVVTVPAGTRSLAGHALAAPAEQRFRTRPLTLTGVFPTGVLRPDSAVAVQFDQDFDPAAVPKFLRVVHAGRTLPYRIVARDEAERSWAKNPTLRYDPDDLAERLGAHHLLIAPAGVWPAGASPQLVLDPRAPSREGPLVTERASYAAFSVARPFRVAGLTCDGRYSPRMAGQRCAMRGFLSVELSNAIQPKTFRSSKIQIEGEPFEDHELSGASVSLLVPDGVGQTRHVTVAGDLVDVYGQPLEGPRRPSFVVARQRFEPYLTAPSGLVILDPRWQVPQWIVTAEAVTGLRVRVFAVTPSDYLAFEAFERGERPAPPGKLVLDERYPVGPRHGAVLRTDLAPHLSATGTGHLIAIVDAQPATRARDFTPRLAAWLQVTRLGASARVDGEHVNAFVQDISPHGFGKPIAGARVSLAVEGRTDLRAATTDAAGHAALDLLDPVTPPHRDRPPTAMLHVATAGDAMFTPLFGHERAQRRDEARWYVTDDRFMYKPGEPVYLKGWVRWTHSGVAPELARPAPGEAVAYTLVDGRGNQLASGSAPLSAHGGFDLEVQLPPNANLGTATFTLSTRTSSIRHPIAIEEFRRPAYAVNLNDDVTHAGATHLVAGEAIEMQASARYYAGGGLPGARIEWRATLEAASYTPPGWSAFRFAPRDDRPAAGESDAAATAALAGDSTATAVFGVAAVVASRPSVLAVDATVTDVDRMTIRASSRPILVHPSTLYVGARLQPRTHDTLELIVTDIDGTPVSGVPIDVAIEAVLWSERGRDDAKVVDRQSCKLVSAAAPVTCRVQRKDADWVYAAVARVEDARHRPSTTAYALPWFNWERDAELALVPDKPSYRPGDVARIEIRSKQVPAVANVTFARQGVIAQRRVELAAASTIVELPIEPGFLPNVHVLVDRWADRPWKQGTSKLPLPHVRSAQLELPVEVESARLAMRARPLAPLVEPGAPATFEVEVAHDGKPVADAEVALLVVDEAVLALTGKSHADPLAPFYRAVAHGTRQLDSADLVRDDGAVLGGTPGFERFALDERGFGSMSGYGVGAGMGSIGTGRYGTIGHGAGTGVVVSRKDFRATAAFSPRLRTDARGKVRLTVTMPDSLTRFRIVALATAETRWFGKAESAIVTQRKINARTVAPRFLSQGDRFALPVVVQNLGRTPRTVDVAVRAANLELRGPAGKRVVLQPGQRAEVRFELATRARGQAVVQTIAVSGTFADASNVELPVYEPATTEAFATYGIVDDKPAFERLEVPADIFTDVGGVEVSMQSTQLASLTDAFWYLYAYPYECAEQRSSRMIATTALADVLEAFAAPGRPSRQEIDATARADVQKLAKDQNADGGWGYFDGMTSDPYVTAQVLVALAAHRADPKVMARAIAFVTKQANATVRTLEAAARRPALERTDHARHAYRVALAAATFTALAAARVDVRARAERLHATATALGAYPIDAKARLLALVAKLPRAGAMRAKLLADLVSATHETAAAATVATRYEEAERAVLVSSTKTTALALDAIMREAPDHALVPKLARGVLDARSRGRWASTQENLVVLQTMRRYFDTYERDTPSYTGRLWFGGAAYAEQAFAGRSTARAVAQVDWGRLPPGSGHDLAIQKAGTGRLYYRVGITYAPKRTDLPALDAGFLVRRSYTAIDDPSDVATQPDGSVKIRLGARVRVTLEAITTTRRHAVALVDPLPAGFEAVNDRLAIAERTELVHGDARWDFRAHRDNRVEVFEMELPEGRHRYTYTARATTPGTFVAAPAKAEEMYSPETFGRSTGTRVVIE